MGYPEMYYIDLKNNLYVHTNTNVGLDLTDDILKDQVAFKDQNGEYLEIQDFDKEIMFGVPETFS